MRYPKLLPYNVHSIVVMEYLLPQDQKNILPSQPVRLLLV